MNNTILASNLKVSECVHEFINCIALMMELLHIKVKYTVPYIICCRWAKNRQNYQYGTVKYKITEKTYVLVFVDIWLFPLIASMTD